MLVDVCFVISARPQILAFKGLSIKDFSTTEEALNVADEIIKRNKAEFGHDKEPHVG